MTGAWPARSFWTWPPLGSVWTWPPRSQKPVTPMRPPLPAAAVAAWHSEIDCSPTAWVDYIGNRSLPGVSSPTVAVDGTLFHGRVVAQSSAAPRKVWVNRSLPTMLSAGTRPWAFVVGRLRSLTPADQAIFSFGSSTAHVSSTLGTQAGVQSIVFDGGTVLATTGPTDTAPHVWKAWLDGVKANFIQDHTLSQLSSTATLPVDVNSVGAGEIANDPANFSNSNIAYALVCSAKPTAAEESALDAWALAYWGVP